MGDDLPSFSPLTGHKLLSDDERLVETGEEADIVAVVVAAAVVVVVVVVVVVRCN